jgi:hypothetical protein
LNYRERLFSPRYQVTIIRAQPEEALLAAADVLDAREEHKTYQPQEC